MTDTHVLLAAAASLIAVLLMPIPSGLRTFLFVAIIGAVAAWELTNGLGTAMQLFD
jgi:hypothetical protein